MPKALVLGGATGLLGQALVHSLNKADWETATLGRNDGNLLDEDFLKAKLQKIAPDIIFNTIAWTQVDDAEEQPEKALALNRIFPDMLARIIENTDAHLVHYSTDFVFSGQPPADYWRETDPVQPTCVYGATKYAGENAVLRLLPQKSCVIRTAWLFGPGRKNFVSTILDASRGKPTLSVVDDQMGSPTYTPDLASWSISLAEKRVTGIWHAVNSGHATWSELAAEALQLVASPCRIHPIHSSEWPQKAKRPRNSILNNNRLTRFLGFRPRPWPQALREYIFGVYLPEKGGKSA